VNWSEINGWSSKLIRDPSEAIWTSDEKLAYANECLDYLVEKVKYLEDYRDYALISGTYLYTVDDDVVEIERVEYNGKHILPLSPNELKDYDINYLYETGEVRRWYPFGTRKIGYYKTPTWTADYSTFDTDWGELIYYESDGDTVTFDSEYGIVIDVDSDESGWVYYFVPDDGFGEAIYIDEAAYTVNHRIVKRPARLVNDDDIPELPAWFHRLIAFFIAWKCLDRDSPGRDDNLAAFWSAIYTDGEKQFFNLYRYAFNTPDHTMEIRRMNKTNKYRYNNGRWYG